MTDEIEKAAKRHFTCQEARQELRRLVSTVPGFTDHSVEDDLVSLLEAIEVQMRDRDAAVKAADRYRRSLENLRPLLAPIKEQADLHREERYENSLGDSE